jgi:integrase/recombinase XerD
MQATKINYKGETRIKIDFPYNQEIAQLIKGIAGAKWSSALNAWHIPYGSVEFNLLKTLFPQIEYHSENCDFKTDIQSIITSNPRISNKIYPVKNVSVQVLGRSIILKLPKNDLDIKFICSLRYSRWDARQFFWIVPNYPGNLDLIKDYFNDRINVQSKDKCSFQRKAKKQ